MPSRAAQYEGRFDQEREAIDGDLRHFDEAFTYAEGVLLEDPECGFQTNTPEIWVATLRFPKSEGGKVRLSVFYKFDSESVVFLSIRETP